MSFYGVAILFVALAVFVEMGMFLGMMRGAGAINIDYYKFSSLARVELEESLIGNVNTQYLNFTSSLGNVFVSDTNGIYTITSGGEAYIVSVK